MIRTQIYIGVRRDTTMQLFRACVTPTADRYPDFFAVIGPFRTLRGARFMRDHGRGNPHLQCVADAERIARSTNAR